MINSFMFTSVVRRKGSDGIQTYCFWPYLISFLKATFEADPVLVSLADSAGQGAAIISPGGDTLCYTGSLQCLVSVRCFHYISSVSITISFNSAYCG